MRNKVKKYLQLIQKAYNLQQELRDAGVRLSVTNNQIHILSKKEEIEKILGREIELITIKPFGGSYDTETTLFINDLELFYLSNRDSI